mgnify:CR=1 FL=1
MTRSLENLFDEPQRKSTTKAPAGGDFDALLDGEQVDTKGAIDPSWDKVKNDKPAAPTPEPRQATATPAATSSLEDDGLDDLMGMTGTTAPTKPKRKIEGLPPEPSLSRGWRSQKDSQASFPWWVIIAAILLILAGAAAVVTMA